MLAQQPDVKCRVYAPFAHLLREIQGVGVGCTDFVQDLHRSHISWDEFPRSSFWHGEIHHGEIYQVSDLKDPSFIPFFVCVVRLNHSTFNDGIMSHLQV